MLPSSMVTLRLHGLILRIVFWVYLYGKKWIKDVYDFFVGHEVGHALETPFEGWHDSPEKLKGCPRSYINVVEDARIERKIQTRYPGLVGAFNRGYDQLLKKEFFGDLTDIDWDQVKLIDKINLKNQTWY